GVGLVLTTVASDQRLGGIDLDGCLDERGELLPWARRIVEKLASYTEISPSGEGLKIFVLYPVALARRGRGKAERRPHYRGKPHKDHAVELFFGQGGSYFTVTGRQHGTWTELRVIDGPTLAWLDEEQAAFKARTKLFQAIDKIANAP